jgi:hypothetical protein
VCIAQRRKEMKQQLHLPEDYGIQDSDDEQRPARAAASGDGGGAAAAAAAHKADVKQYQQGAFTTTVSVTAFNARYRCVCKLATRSQLCCCVGAECNHARHAMLTRLHNADRALLRPCCAAVLQ